MSIETWREKYAHLLEEVTLKSKYSDEADSGDYKRLARTISKDDFGKNGKGGFWSRPQIRKNGARTVSRTVPAWFFNDAAIQKFLIIQFPKMGRQGHLVTCNCPACRNLRSAALWYFIILRLRMNEPAEEIARNWAPMKPKSKPKKVSIKPDISNEDPAYWEGVLRHELADSNERDVNSDDAVVFNSTTGELDPVPFACPEGRPITARHVRRILQQIRFVAAGLRTDGKPRKKPDPGPVHT